jgi:hypothetical protein
VSPTTPGQKNSCRDGSVTLLCQINASTRAIEFA